MIKNVYLAQLFWNKIMMELEAVFETIQILDKLLKIDE